MHLDEAIQRFLCGYFSTRDRSERTYGAYSIDLLQFAHALGHSKELTAIDVDTIESYAGTLKSKRYAPASQRRKMVSLRVFFQYWARRGEIRVSPFWALRLSFGPSQNLPQTLTQVEVGLLLRQACAEVEAAGPPSPGRLDRRFLVLRNLALIDLLLATGIRIGEAASLTIQSLSLAEETLSIKGKGRRPRLAYLVDPQSLDLEKKHLELRCQLTAPTSSLFLNSAATPLSTQGMAKVLTALRRRAGITRHITPHMLRHTVATFLLRNGADIREVQEFLGHASITSTQRYTHVSKEHLKTVLRSKHPLVSFRSQQQSLLT